MSFRKTLRPLAGCRLLCVDPGARFLGLAVRVCRKQGVQPYGLLERVPSRRGFQTARNWDWTLGREHVFGRVISRFRHPTEAIISVLTEQNIAAVIYGMPYLADGSRSPECAVVERQALRLQRECATHGISIPILLWDESWSTQMAMGEQRRTARSARASHSIAACFILQEVVDALVPIEEEELRSQC